jgi:probable LLM family oxidoreductase
MQIGVDTFVEMSPNSPDAPEQVGTRGVKRVAQLMEEMELADRVGLDVFGIGEHHRAEYIASTPAILLAAGAARTKNIKLTSAVTVLSSDDPVRVFQDFATLDLISNGRAEIIVGRGSFIESYPLFGYDLKNYDELFAEKLDLLLQLREKTNITWEGNHRPSLHGEGVWPRPLQKKLTVRLGVGGTTNSFIRAGKLGLPLTVAIIGGDPRQFRPLVDLYRQTYKRAGHSGEPDVNVHGLGFVADSTELAMNTWWPTYQDTFSRIGRERGWGPITRRAFEAQCSANGAFMVGDATAVAKKIQLIDQVLGGITGVAINLSGGVPHEAQLRAIELLGKEVRSRVEATNVEAS